VARSRSGDDHITSAWVDFSATHRRSGRSAARSKGGGIARPRRPQPLIRRFFLPHTHRLTRRRPGMAIIKFAIVVREAHTFASLTGLLWALVAERPVALPPVWLEEGSMSKADEYRQFANDCIVWARIAISDDQREQFLELAKKWMQDAEMIDQGIERANKASEMAGREIDLLGDPSATDEERQLRKQRLIKGPQEFRDIRSNRATI